MKELIYPCDPYRMNWIEGSKAWGTIWKVPEGISVAIDTTAAEDAVYERYTFTNITDDYLFTSRDSIGIYTPFNDNYESGEVCLHNRCHAHLFCGENVCYIMALRMGGEGPHLGLVLTEGSIYSYSVERDLSQQSNDRGDFILHPSPVEMLAPGESFTVGWTLFWHDGPEDFYRQLPLRNPKHLDVRAENYTIFMGEQVRLTITPAFAFQKDCIHITRDGKVCPFTIEGTQILVREDCDRVGERIYRIAVHGICTTCRLLVQPDIRTLAEARCRFIAAHQQIRAERTKPDGAYVIYDNEEKHRYFSRQADHSSARERVGMGVLLACWLKKYPDPELEDSLRRYKAFMNREIVDCETGMTCDHHGRRNANHRLYNYPWTAQFYINLYDLWHEREDLLTAYRIMKQFYIRGGASFYGFLLPVTEMLDALAEEGLHREREDILAEFCAHGEVFLQNGTQYPPHEVKFEQCIVVAPVMLLNDLYKVTGEERYLEGAAKHLRILELFNGRQPDWHLYEVSLRHWDGYWFGKRKLYGDTFPHYWSTLTACCYEGYADITGETYWRQRAEAAYRGVLGMFRPDGSASCAYVYPMTVNGNPGEFFDPYANDQDWGLYCYLKHDEKIKKEYSRL